jgi:hypothetical protein
MQYSNRDKAAFAVRDLPRTKSQRHNNFIWEEVMKTLTALLIAALVSLGQFASTASAETPDGVKLYVFSSGALTIGKGVLQNFGPK